jgi:hypothetical protein
MSAPDWSLRVAPALNSRHVAVFILIGITLLNSFSIFLYFSAAEHIPFKSNVFISFILLHSLLVLVLLASMLVTLWQWRMEQYAVVGCFVWISLWNFLYCTYVSIATYSSAALTIKLLLWIVILSYQVWWASRVIRLYKIAWENPKLRALMLAEKDDHFLFYAKGEVLVREKIGFQAHGKSIAVIMFIALGIATFFERKLLVEYFGVDWALIAYSIVTLSLSPLVISLFTISLQYLIYSWRLFRKTGKVIYLDNLSNPPIS